MPGTDPAASRPFTLLRIPALGIGSMRTPAAPGSRSRSSMSRPAARRRISSSSETPVPKRSVREQRPPMERAAISMTTARSPSTRSSACTGPSMRPRAAAACAVVSRIRVCAASGRRDGVTYSVSSKNGPVSGSGLSNSARTLSLPSARIPSTATSTPGTYSSTRIRPTATGSRPRTSGVASSAAILWNAATKPAGSSARMTPRDAERCTGLRTTG